MVSGSGSMNQAGNRDRWEGEKALLQIFCERQHLWPMDRERLSNSMKLGQFQEQAGNRDRWEREKALLQMFCERQHLWPMDRERLSNLMKLGQFQEPCMSNWDKDHNHTRNSALRMILLQFLAHTCHNIGWICSTHASGTCDLAGKRFL